MRKRTKYFSYYTGTIKTLEQMLDKLESKGFKIKICEVELANISPPSDKCKPMYLKIVVQKGKHSLALLCLDMKINPYPLPQDVARIMNECYVEACNTWILTNYFKPFEELEKRGKAKRPWFGFSYNTGYNHLLEKIANYFSQNNQEKHKEHNKQTRKQQTVEPFGLDANWSCLAEV